MPRMNTLRLGSSISLLSHHGEPYVVTALSKGLHPRTVALHHVMRAALIPTVTIVGINMGYLLGGAIVARDTSLETLRVL